MGGRSRRRDDLLRWWTPSRLDPGGLDAILQAIRARRPVAPDAEVTLEANPEDVTADRARRWRDSGVNRSPSASSPSIRRCLTWMHRTHAEADASRARSVCFAMPGSPIFRLT